MSLILDYFFVLDELFEECESTNEPLESCSAIQAGSELRESFCNMAALLLRHLIENNTSAEKLRKHIAALALSLSSKTNVPIKQGVDQVENIMNLSDLFHYLNANIWNFFDYHLLKYVIHQLGGDLENDLIKRYISNFRSYEQSTLLLDFFESWPGRMMKPPGYAEVTTSIQADPQHYTLAQLNKLRQHICTKFLPSNSEYAMLYYKHQPERKGIHVTWIMPPGLAVRLKEASSHPDAHDFLKKYQATLHITADTSVKRGMHTVMQSLLEKPLWMPLFLY